MSGRSREKRRVTLSTPNSPAVPPSRLTVPTSSANGPTAAKKLSRNGLNGSTNAFRYTKKTLKKLTAAPEESVKVAVRVRPFNNRELQTGANSVVQIVDRDTAVITDPSGAREVKTFAFDHAYWSCDGFQTTEKGVHVATDDRYAGQDNVYNDLGEPVLANALDGYNAALFAYGQTGSGKSYTMVGYGSNDGIIPRLCQKLFAKANNPAIEYHITFSMLEIYNERIKDLLSSGDTEGLRLRQHPKRGFYVDGLVKSAVSSYKDVSYRMKLGNHYRTTAQTAMNDTSSRSHMVVTLNIKQIFLNDKGQSTTKYSDIHLVDLAGSERAGTSALVDRLKEGASINQSLSTLGNVIAALAERSSAVGKKRGDDTVIPYRNSVLTKILQNALGGNSKTVMIATVSPSHLNYEESLSTLRFADRAKQIKTRAIVNESPTDKLIRELREENTRLRQLLESEMDLSSDDVARLRADERQVDLDIRELQDEWSKRLDVARKEWEAQVSSEANFLLRHEDDVRNDCHLSNVNDDSQLSHVIKQVLPEGVTMVGRVNNSLTEEALDDLYKDVDYIFDVSGPGMHPRHCLLSRKGTKVTVTPELESQVFLNGEVLPCGEPRGLNHLDRLVFGACQAFLFFADSSVRDEQRSRLQQQHHAVGSQRASLQGNSKGKEEAEEEKVVGVEGAEGAEGADDDERIVQEYNFDFIQMEIASSQGVGQLLKTSASSMEMNPELQHLRQSLIIIAPLLATANAISIEMRKGVRFELLVKAMSAHSVNDSSKELLVQVTNQSNGYVWHWNQQKFLHRLELMKLAYEAYSDFSRDQMGDSPFSTGSEGALANSRTGQHADKSGSRGVLTGAETRNSPNPRPGTGHGRHSMQFLRKGDLSLISSHESNQGTRGTGPKHPSKITRYAASPTSISDGSPSSTAQPRLPTSDPVVSSHGSTVIPADPFWDPPEDIFLGTALVYLQPLAYGVCVDEVMPVMDYRGITIAHLRVCICLCDENGNPLADFSFATEPAELLDKRVDVLVKITYAKDVEWVMQDTTRGVQAKYRFYTDSRMRSTKAVIGTSNPQFRYHKQFTIKTASNNFVNYLKTNVVLIELWGKQGDGKRSLGSAKPSSSSLAVCNDLTHGLDDSLQTSARSNAPFSGSEGDSSTLHVPLSSQRERAQSASTTSSRRSTVTVSDAELDAVIHEAQWIEERRRLHVVIEELQQEIDFLKIEKGQLEKEMSVIVLRSRSNSLRLTPSSVMDNVSSFLEKEEALLAQMDPDNVPVQTQILQAECDELQATANLITRTLQTIISEMRERISLNSTRP